MISLSLSLSFTALFGAVVFSPAKVFGLATTGGVFNGEEWVQIDSSHHSGQVQSPPPPIIYTTQSSTATIKVSIASFRDHRCPVTLNNLFSKAKFPDRVFVGLVDQIHTEEDSTTCLNAYCRQQGGSVCTRRNQIDQVVFSFQDSRGPAFARSLQNDLIHNEDFCMQVDSHVDVVQDWDVELIKMWQSTQNEYGVLSTVPPDLPSLGKNVHDNFEVPHVCHATLNPSGLVRHLLPRAAMNLETPLLAPFWSAAFSFSKCHAEVKVPSDPNSLYIFDGEDFSKYARLWTRGYDVYTPSRILVAHDNAGKLKSPNAVTANNVDPFGWVTRGMKDTYRYEMFEESVQRIKTLLGMPDGDRSAFKVAMLTKFGLGMKRTLSQFIEFTGVDTRNNVVFGDRCKELSWVPFRADGVPNTDSTDVWGNNPEVQEMGGKNIPLFAGNIEFALFSNVRESGESMSSHHQFSASDSLNIAKGELWWIFQSIDRGVESIILQVDREVGSGYGHRTLKLILLLAPLFVGVLYAAIQVMIGANRPFREDAKRI